MYSFNESSDLNRLTGHRVISTRIFYKASLLFLISMNRIFLNRGVNFTVHPSNHHCFNHIISFH